uniref:PCI domain-containing protein n=1 Tax=Cafeteria roenbergensis TaxID=33653 RepID=A0A7S0JUB5_CAFRO
MAHVASASGAGSASAAGEGAAASGASRPESSAPVVDRSSVEGIKARYRGNALIERLSYLGEVAPASRSSAMALAAAESKAVGSDTGLYASLCEAAGTDPDAEWVSATKARVHTRQEALERELNMKLAAQDRDAIFEAHTAVAKHFADIGSPKSSIASFMRAREYCTPSQLVSNTTDAAKVALGAQQVSSVEGIIRSTLSGATHATPQDHALLHAVMGAARLQRGNFAGAAQSFLAAGPALDSSVSDSIHRDDVAVAATLCSLAAMDRSRCIRMTQESIDFRRTVAAVPDAEALAADYARGQFGAVIRGLDAIEPSLTHDALIGPQWSALKHSIISRVVSDAVAPYARASIAAMSKRLSLPEAQLSDVVVSLIARGLLPARLDAAGGVIVARYSEQRPAVFAEATALAERMARETKQTLLRASMEQHHLAVKPPKNRRTGLPVGMAEGLEV